MCHADKPAAAIFRGRHESPLPTFFLGVKGRQSIGSIFLAHRRLFLSSMSTSSVVALVHPDERLERVLSDIELACVHLGSVHHSERASATTLLLSLSQSIYVVDDACFVLAASSSAHNDMAHFHVFGALINSASRLLPEDGRIQARYLIDVRDWLLQWALVQAQQTVRSGRAWPKYVQARCFRAIVLLSMRISCSSHEDASSFIALSARMTDLLASEDDADLAVGLGLARALAEEFLHYGLRQHDVDTGTDSSAGAGFCADDYMWCATVMEVQMVPVILPPLLNALHALTKRCESAYSIQDDVQYCRTLGLWQAAAECANTWLSWRCVPLDPVRTDPSVTTWTPAELWRLVHESTAQPVDVSSSSSTTRKVSAHVATLLLHPEIPTLLGYVARIAVVAMIRTSTMVAPALAARSQDLSHVCASHANVTTRAVHEAMLHVASYLPWDVHASTTWPAQRVALLDELNQVLHVLAAQLNTLDTERVALLQRLTHVYTQLMHGQSGCVLIQGGIVGANVLLDSLVRVTKTCFQVAFELVPRMRDAEDPITATSASEAAVDEVLSLWRSLLITLPPPDAAYTHPYVRDHVVLPYQAGRLHAAMLTAESDWDDFVAAENTSDADLYDEHLTLYAALARTCVYEAVQQLVASKPAVSDRGHISPAIWEQWHWLALMTGHLIADDSASEVALVPEGIQASCPEAQDQIHALLQDFMSLLAYLVSNGPNSSTPCSPQALISTLWLTARWIPVYLLRESPSRIEAPFAGSMGERFLDELVPCLRTALVAWRSDSDVIVAISLVWEALARSSGAMQIWLAKEPVFALVKDTLATLELLPDAAQPFILRALVRCVDATRDGHALAAQVRGMYYPLIMHAAQARFDSAAHASPVSLSSALSLWHALVDAADPSTSGAVHIHILSQLPAMVTSVEQHLANADVQVSAGRATLALLRALPELQNTSTLLAGSAQHVLELLRAMLTSLTDQPRVSGLDATFEELLVLYLSLLEELVRACASSDAAEANASHADDLRLLCLGAFGAVMPMLKRDVLTIPSVAEAFAQLVHVLLIMARSALYSSTHGACPFLEGMTPSFDVLDMGMHSILPQNVQSNTVMTLMNPLQMVLRAAVYTVGTADSFTESIASGIAQGIGYVSEILPCLQTGASVLVVQQVWDDVIADLCTLLFLRVMQPAMLTPLVLALRRVVLCRIDAAALGGQDTLVATLSQRCAFAQVSGVLSEDMLAHVRQAYASTVEQTLQRIFASRAPPPVSAPSPALAARANIKAERAAEVAFNRAMRPFVLQARGTLLLH